MHHISIGSARRFVLLASTFASLAIPVVHASSPSARAAVASFEHDPLSSAVAVREGDVGARLRWRDDPPAFPGDRRGSLSVHYDSNAGAARLGWALPQALDERDCFTLYAVARIQPDGFFADPFGFFQISWALYNSATTGLERTGSAISFAADTFDLIEFDYYPNQSPFFGGPFVTPTILGAADRRNPLFPFLGAFANGSFGSAQQELPLAADLLIATEYHSKQQTLTTRVWQIAASGELVELLGARTQAPLSALSLPQFSVDRFGFTLWQDGFEPPAPALDARVTFQALGVWIGSNPSPEVLLATPVRGLP